MFCFYKCIYCIHTMFQAQLNSAGAMQGKACSPSMAVRLGAGTSDGSCDPPVAGFDSDAAGWLEAAASWMSASALSAFSLLVGGSPCSAALVLCVFEGLILTLLRLDLGACL